MAQAETPCSQSQRRVQHTRPPSEFRGLAFPDALGPVALPDKSIWLRFSPPGVGGGHKRLSQDLQTPLGPFSNPLPCTQCTHVHIPEHRQVSKIKKPLHPNIDKPCRFGCPHSRVPGSSQFGSSSCTGQDSGEDTPCFPVLGSATTSSGFSKAWDN